MRLSDTLITHGSSDHLEHRKLKPGMRPVQNADDPLGFCSAADSRLTVYPTVEAARSFWYAFSNSALRNNPSRIIPHDSHLHRRRARVKGNNFSIASLLGVEPGSDQARMFEGGSVAIFRYVAPRRHSSLSASSH